MLKSGGALCDSKVWGQEINFASILLTKFDWQKRRDHTKTLHMINPSVDLNSICILYVSGIARNHAEIFI